MKLTSIITRKKQKSENAKLAMTVNGHKLYTFDHFIQLSLYRAVGIKIFYHQLELGVKRTDFDVFQDMIDECINEGNLSKIGQLNGTMRIHRNQYCNPRVTMQIASWGILVDDEPYEKPRKQDQIIKQELLKDEKVHAFFLNTALRYLQELSTHIEISKAKEYMTSKKAKRIEAVYLKLMSLESPSDLWTPLIPK